MWGSRSSYSIELSFDIFMSFSSIYIQLGSLDTIVRGTSCLQSVGESSQELKIAPHDLSSTSLFFVRHEIKRESVETYSQKG